MTLRIPLFTPRWHLVLLTGFLFLVACNRPTVQSAPALVPIEDVVVHDSFSSNVIVTPAWVGILGLGIGYVWPDQIDVHPNQRRQTKEIHLEEGEPFDPYLILASDETRTVLVTMLLDYQQIEFTLDGKKGLLHEVVVEPGGDLQIPLELPIEEPGMHDLVVIAFGDPYNTSLDIDHRMSGALTSSRRAVVFIGNEERDGQTLPPVLSGKPIPEEVSLGLGASFASVEKGKGTHPSERQLYVTEAKAGEDFDYQLWLSNIDEDTVSNYAIVTFLNYHQVPINGQPVLTTALEPQEELILDARIPLPPEPGINQMEMIYLLDPYRSLLGDEVKSSIVLNSFRIAIDAYRAAR